MCAIEASVDKYALMHCYFMSMLCGFANVANEKVSEINARLAELTPEGPSTFEKGTIKEIPGSKVTIFRDPKRELVVVDCWQTTSLSGKSCGTVTIAAPDIVVWMMQYYGEYSAAAIPFLKEALAHNFHKEIFLGGRGPSSFSKNGLVYVNIPISTGMDQFWGREEVREVRNGRDILLGWHNYHGMGMWK